MIHVMLYKSRHTYVAHIRIVQDSAEKVQLQGKEAERELRCNVMAASLEQGAPHHIDMLPIASMQLLPGKVLADLCCTLVPFGQTAALLQ